MQLLSTVTASFWLAQILVLSNAQDNPATQRLNIQGSFPILSRPQFRNERLNNVGPLIRIRRPLVRPSNSNSLPPQQRNSEEAKPVTEEPEDIQETFVPQILQQQQQQEHQSRQAQFYQSEPNSIQDEVSIEEKVVPRFQERPTPRIPLELQGIGANAQRFALNNDRTAAPRPTTLRPRPVNREPRPQFEQQPQQNTQTSRHHINPRPIQFNPIQNEVRNKKPVAQILRKWREEHEDGAITWGFENDDGSFKEETIGIDCVTRGRYGYVDPDGLKREYNYETGNQCDPNTRGQENYEPDEKQPSATGYVNYENNKAVLPSGVEIDLSQMGKKKSKRPGAILTNPQQFYNRN